MKIYIQIQRCLFLPACLLAIGLLAINIASAQRPTITSFSPSSGAPGSSITITGTNFNSTLGSNIVFVGGIRATVTSASATSLTVTAPRGASYGPITVMNTANSLLAYSSQYFLPTITGPTKELLIKADLTYQSTYSVPGGEQPTRIRALVAGDLTGDGIPDLVLSNHGARVNPATNVIRNTIVTSGTISTGTLTSVTFSGYDGQGRPEMGDMDGDGDLDVVSIANVYNASGTIVLSSDVFVLRNSGTGVFTSVGPFAIGAGGVMAAIADIDGDGKSDIASFNYQSTNISILLNTSAGGTIGFSPTVNLASTSRPLFGMLVDLDGDNKPDIIQSNSSAGTGIGIRLNTSSVGSVSFSPTTTVNPSGADDVAQVAAGDLDGDGKLDLVLAMDGSGQNSVVVLRNTSTPGNLSFGTPYYINIGFRQRSIALGDLNGDGRAELLVNPDNTTYETFVFANTGAIGNISFNIAEQFTTSTGGGFASNFADGLVVADFNNDGINDVLSAVTNQTRINIYKGSPQFPPTISSFNPVSQVPGSNIVISGTGFNSTHGNNTVYFGPVAATSSAGNSTSLTVSLPIGAAHAPITVLNNNNLLSTSATRNFLPVFTPNKSILAATDLTNQGTLTLVTGSNLYGMAVGDLTKDGYPELIVSNPASSDKLLIYPNSSSSGGAISLSTAVTLTLPASLDDPRHISVADLDGNGWLDLVVPSFAMNNVGVYLNPGTGSLSGFTLTGSFGTAAGPNGVVSGDLDGDGRIDMVTANYYGSNVSVFRNISLQTGTAGFAAKQDFALSASDATYNLTLADIDNDGKLDIIAGRDINSNPGEIVVLKNTSTVGSISFAAAQNFASVRAPWTIVPSDIDGDGLMDLVVSSGGTSSTQIAVHRNTSSGGTIGFSTINLSVSTTNRAIAVGDMNGDGKPDIISGTSNDPGTGYKTYIFPNTSTSGNISFDTRIDLPASQTPFTAVATDMNRDGKPDIMMGNQSMSSDGTLTIYRNTLILPPTTQAHSINTSSTGTTATLTWTNGNGNKRAVFVNATSSGTATPLSLTDYTANTVFEAGSQIGSTGWYCVYNGVGNTVTITGLSPATTYRAMVTEFNDGGFTGTAQYNTNTATNNPVNVTTHATVTAISRTTASATINTATADFSVTFNAVVTGLATGRFSLTAGGSIAGASLSSVTGSGSTFTVTVNTGSGDGTIRLNLINTTSMSAGVTNTLPVAGETYIIDKTAPNLSPVTILSNNSNTSRAKAGDMITISFTASEAIATPTVTIAGQTASVTNTGGDNWSATYTMTGTDPDGAVSFNIAFNDLVGNAGTVVTTTTNSSSVVFDKTVPGLSPVTIASDNGNPSLAKAGNTVTLNFTSSETINTPTAIIMGNAVTATNTGGNNWTASYTLANGNTEGAVSFSIAFSDLFGNTGTTVTATTNSSNVVFDKTIPELGSVTIASNNSIASKARPGDVITIAFTAAEALSTPVVTIAGNTAAVANTSGNNWSATYTMGSSDAEGTLVFSIAFSDVSGNPGITVSATTNSSSVVFDKTIPTLGNVTIASNNANSSKAKPGNVVTVSFTTSEAIVAPVVTIAGNTASVTNTSANNWSATYTMGSSDAEGTIAFDIAFSDASGNAGTAVTVATNSSSVVFDKTLPTLSNVAIASNNSNTSKAKPGNVVTVGFTASETIAVPTVTIAGNTASVTNTFANNWMASYTMGSSDADGTIAFIIAFNDASGNAGAPVTATNNSSSVVFDKTMPTLSNVIIASNNGNASKAKTGDMVTVGFTASESILMPTVTIAGHTASVANTSANNWVATYTMSSSDADGTVAFTIVFSDVSGNAGTAVTATTNSSSVVFDKTLPTLSNITIASNNSNASKAKPGDMVTVGFTASESIVAPTVTIAGQAASVTNISGNSWSATYTMSSSDADGTVAFTITFSDASGNAGTAVTAATNSSSVVFDKTLPTLSNIAIVSNNSNTSKAKPGDIITVGFTASESILMPAVTIAGHTALLTNTSGNDWTASYTMSSSDADGAVAFTITFSDVSGNAGTAVTATSNSSSVVFDKTNPQISAVAVISGNSNSGWAKTGDKITLNFTVSESVMLPVVSIAAHSITPVTVSGNAWSAAYTMTGSDAEGAVPLSITVTDLAGNTGISATATTDNSSVVFDKTIPVIQPVSIVSNNTLTQTALTGNMVTVSFTVSEGVLTPTVLIAGHAVSATYTTGNAWVASYTMQGADSGGMVSFSIIASDNAGNTSAVITASSDNTSVNFIKSGTPVFTNGTSQNISICENASADINDLLKVTHTAAGEQVTLTVTGAPSNGTLTGFISSLMSNGNVVTPSGIAYHPAAGYTGTDAFTIQVTNGLVTSYTTIQVVVNAKPVAAAIAGSTILCEGLSSTLSTSGGSSYKWFRDGNMINGVSVSQLTITSPGSYTAIITNAAGCEIPASNNIAVVLLQKPKADFIVDALNCTGKPVAATSTSVVAGSGTVSYLWNDGNGNTSASASPSFVYTQTGNYNIKLKIVPNACPAIADSITRSVAVSQPVAGVRNPTVDIVVNEATQLPVRTLPGVSYQWSPGRFLQQTNIANPVITASAEQEYEIRLTTTSGCVTVDTLLVRVHQPRSVYLPNVFTPNGDGRNDILKPILVGVKQMRYFRVYNRWGKLVFETTNASQGWDGRFNGVLQPMDTYTWSIEGLGDDNSMVKRQGSVSLLR